MAFLAAGTWTGEQVGQKYLLLQSQQQLSTVLVRFRKYCWRNFVLPFFRLPSL